MTVGLGALFVAFQVVVSAQQREAGGVVGEGVGVEADHLEAAAAMIGLNRIPNQG